MGKIVSQVSTFILISKGDPVRQFSTAYPPLKSWVWYPAHVCGLLWVGCLAGLSLGGKEKNFILFYMGSTRDLFDLSIDLPIQPFRWAQVDKRFIHLHGPAYSTHRSPFHLLIKTLKPIRSNPSMIYPSTWNIG